jgi:drug/metabolite transporter (DMT)-like permease
VQLAVPVLAAIAGIIFLSEKLSLRLLLSAMMILGGIGLALAGREFSRHKRVRADEDRT